MAANNPLSPGQRALATEVAAILAADRDDIDAKAILAAARAAKVLAPREALVLEKRGRLPDWMLDALDLRAAHAPSASFGCERAFTGRTHRLAPPAVLHATALPEVFDVGDRRSPDVDVISGEGAELMLGNRAKACFLADGYVPPLTDEDNLWAWEVLRRRPATHLPGRSLVLFVEGSQLLSHWLLDTLPRLAALEKTGRSLTDYDHFVFSSTPSPFHAETLEALGVARDKVVTRATSGGRFRCDSFDSVTAVRRGYVADPWVYDFVERAFGAPEAEPRRKLFISRANARRRRIVDEAELWPILRRRGYENIRPEEMTLRQTARLCAEASAVVAPHGAGVANTVFCRPGARVLEIFGAHVSAEYWRVCSQRGLVYACHQASRPDGGAFTPEGLAPMGVLERKEADMALAPAELEQVLDAFEGL